MLPLLFLGPHASGRDIDVYLRPLVEELKDLWHEGVETFCDAPNPGGPLTTRQPAENLCVSYHETLT